MRDALGSNLLEGEYYAYSVSGDGQKTIVGELIKINDKKVTLNIVCELKGRSEEDLKRDNRLCGVYRSVFANRLFPISMSEVEKEWW